MAPDQHPHLLLRVQRQVLALSVALFAVKLSAYWLTHSLAILTDALEGIVNMATAAIGYYTLRYAVKPRDADHPYGHGKVELLAALAEGIMIVLAGAAILYEGASSLWVPPTLRRLDLGLLLVAVAGAANYAMGQHCVRVGRKERSLALVASGQHLKADTYSSVGLLLGLGLVRATGWQWADGALAIGFGLFIGYSGIRTLRQTVGGIMDEADFTLLQGLVRLLEERRPANWIDLHNLRIIKYGGIVHIDCHLTVPWFISVREAHQEIDLFRRLAKQEFGEQVEAFIHTDGCLPYSCGICPRETCPHRQGPFEATVPWTIERLTKDQKHRLPIVEKREL